jgi:hypothetical protein
MAPEAYPAVLLACIFAAFVMAAVVAMVDIKRNAYCDKCVHCAAVAKDRAERKAEERHRMYHHWAGGAVSLCSNPKCKGR